jgi:hypothetical protein
MHRVFYMQEFVEKIMDELDVSGGQKDLARLARTCRLFTDPALNRLWASPDDGAWHLTQRMSETLWKIEKSYIEGFWYKKMVCVFRSRLRGAGQPGLSGTGKRLE